MVDRNLTIGPAEADLICIDPDGRTLVIVEVKTRRVGGAVRASPPAEANITAHKRRMLAGVARAVRTRTGWTDRPVRIDVVAVDLPARGGRPLEIRVYPGSVGG